VKKWTFPALLLAAGFIMAAPAGTLVPSFGGAVWYFPIGTIQTIALSPGLQAFFGVFRSGIQNANFVQLEGNSAANAPIISGNSDITSDVGLVLTTKGASSVESYPGTDSQVGFVVKNASQTVSELTVDTSAHRVNVQTLTISAPTRDPSPGTLVIGQMMFYVGCGTAPSTSALYLYAGTSTGETRIANNVGEGVPGC
jgi:hypothetical protein